jgi:hypothetical protein
MSRKQPWQDVCGNTEAFWLTMRSILSRCSLRYSQWHELNLKEVIRVFQLELPLVT